MKCIGCEQKTPHQARDCPYVAADMGLGYSVHTASGRCWYQVARIDQETIKASTGTLVVTPLKPLSARLVEDPSASIQVVIYRGGSPLFQATQGYCEGLVVPESRIDEMCGHPAGCCWEQVVFPVEVKNDGVEGGKDDF